MEDNNIQSPKIRLADQPWSECECGGRLFEGAVVAKKISPIISPSGKEEFYPIEVLYCVSCKKIPSFIYNNIPVSVPDELKAAPKSSILQTS